MVFSIARKIDENDTHTSDWKKEKRINEKIKFSSRKHVDERETERKNHSIQMNEND